MRLLNTSTLEVEEFIQSGIPEYVILSHTWEEEEVTLQDMQSGAGHAKKGYAKIKGCCEKAAEDGFRYCWIDTCCIDKTSSAELSEAINSMYQWYKNSRICYAYLADFEVDSDTAPSMASNWVSKLGSQRWFKRGWTLQELIAPTIVEFYDVKWNEIGTRLSLRERLSEITGINRDVLYGGDPTRRTVAVRMSWAAKRTTTRIEDEAYCLMGLFGVNMPLLYGEGTRAFRRLQEEIMRVEEDYTLLVWSPGISSIPGRYCGLLADAPSDFATFWAETDDQSPTISQAWHPDYLSRHHFSLFPPAVDHTPPYFTSHGLRITLPVMPTETPETFYACITLIFSKEREEHMLCATFHRWPLNGCYVRLVDTPFLLLPRNKSRYFKYSSIYVEQPPIDLEPRAKSSSNGFSLLFLKSRENINWPFVCTSTPVVNMDEVIRARFGSQTLTYRTVDNGVTIARFDSKTNRHRVNELVTAAAGLTQVEMHQISMGNPTTCFFPCENVLKDTFRFAFDDRPGSAFDVELNLKPDKPLCTARFCRSNAHKGTPSGMPYEPRDLQKSDRVTLFLRIERHDADQLQKWTEVVEITISIRQIAAPPKIMNLAQTFVLSINLMHRDLGPSWDGAIPKLVLTTPEDDYVVNREHAITLRIGPNDVDMETL